MPVIPRLTRDPLKSTCHPALDAGSPEKTKGIAGQAHNDIAY